MAPQVEVFKANRVPALASFPAAPSGTWPEAVGALESAPKRDLRQRLTGRRSTAGETNKFRNAHHDVLVPPSISRRPPAAAGDQQLPLEDQHPGELARWLREQLLMRGGPALERLGVRGLHRRGLLRGDVDPSRSMSLARGLQPGMVSAALARPRQRMMQSRMCVFSPSSGHRKRPWSSARNQFTWKMRGPSFIRLRIRI
jgi:hypothetical protein